MSFIQSTIKCSECGKEMNVAFGIVGITQIAGWPEECPRCHSNNLKQISQGWNAKIDTMTTQSTKIHKPGCNANRQCLVVHTDDVCPGPYGQCNCDQLDDVYKPKTAIETVSAEQTDGHTEATSTLPQPSEKSREEERRHESNKFGALGGLIGKYWRYQCKFCKEYYKVYDNTPLSSEPSQECKSQTGVCIGNGTERCIHTKPTEVPQEGFAKRFSDVFLEYVVASSVELDDDNNISLVIGYSQYENIKAFLSQVLQEAEQKGYERGINHCSKCK